MRYAPSVLVGLALWTIAARQAGPLLLASPLEVLQAFGTDYARLGDALLQTGLASIGGLVLATALGLSLAVGAWASGAVRDALLPWTTVLQVVPIVAVAPLLVTWLGYGLGVALVTSVLAAFYPVYSAALTGLVGPSQDLVDLLRLYRATRLRELVVLRLPAALPALFSGLRTAAGLSVIGAIIGEFVGSNGFPPTLGYLVVYAARSARPDLGFAAIACAAALALSLHLGLRVAERRTIGRWYGA